MLDNATNQKTRDALRAAHQARGAALFEFIDWILRRK